MTIPKHLLEAKVCNQKTCNVLNDYKSRCETVSDEIRKILDIWENKPSEIATLDLEYLLNILENGKTKENNSVSNRN